MYSLILHRHPPTLICSCTETSGWCILQAKKQAIFSVFLHITIFLDNGTHPTLLIRHQRLERLSEQCTFTLKCYTESALVNHSTFGGHV